MNEVSFEWCDDKLVFVKYTSKYGAEIVQYERKDTVPDYRPGMIVRIDSAVTKTYF